MKKGEWKSRAGKVYRGAGGGRGKGGTAGGIAGWQRGRHWGVENKIKRVVSIARET